jgi:hypothetical protein
MWTGGSDREWLQIHMFTIPGDLNIIKFYGIKDKSTVLLTVRMSSSLTNGLVVVVGSFGQCFHRTLNFYVNKSYVKYVVYDGRVKARNGMSPECLMAQDA